MKPVPPRRKTNSPPLVAKKIQLRAQDKKLNPANEPLTLSIPLEKSIIYDTEFLWFANSFAKGFRTLQPYEYKSRAGKYTLKYFESWKAKFPDAELMQIKTPARTSSKDGHIECSKEVLQHEAFTEDFVFFLMLWSRAVYMQFYDTLAADRIALLYYALTGRSKKEIIKGFCHMCSSIDANPELTITRIEQAVTILKK